MNTTLQDWTELGELARHLKDRRGAILQSWRLAAQADPKLTTVSVLSRSQFYDHIPDVLDAYAHRLEARNVAERSEATIEQRASAAGHGLHRWQQGYQDGKRAVENADWLSFVPAETGIVVHELGPPGEQLVVVVVAGLAVLDVDLDADLFEVVLVHRGVDVCVPAEVAERGEVGDLVHLAAG
jgi:hypothetical protein